jgi:uncharacterized protein YkwD
MISSTLKKSLFSSALLAAALTLSACAGTGPSVQTSSNTITPALQSDASMMTLVNSVRTQNGLRPLARSSRLDAIAAGHGRDMAVNNYFAHKSPAGSTMASRLNAGGYKSCTSAENIGYGSLYSDPAKMMAGWMASPGHRTNLLHPRVTEVGFAKVQDPDGSHNPLWVMNFGRPC